MSATADEPREVRMPPPERSSDSGNKLERPLFLWHQTGVNIGIFLAPGGPSGPHSSRAIHSQPLERQVTTASVDPWNRMSDVNFHVHQCTIPKV